MPPENIQLGATVRYRRVYIVQSLSQPVNDHVMELLMMLDIARGAAASEVHAIIPYYSFGRSDKKDAPRISITARLVADLLKTAGATHVMSMMFHSPQVHGFFAMPTDPLSARPIFRDYLAAHDLTGHIVVAPDMGAAKSAARFAKSLNLPVAAGNKERVSDTEVRIVGLVGSQVSGHKRALRPGSYRAPNRGAGSPCARIALLRQRLAHHQDARQLTVRSRDRLQRHARHAEDLLHRLLEQPDQLERALHLVLRPRAGLFRLFRAQGRPFVGRVEADAARG